jgi:DNA-directed RNA polymerase specialized sigma24 family protein
LNLTPATKSKWLPGELICYSSNTPDAVATPREIKNEIQKVTSLSPEIFMKFIHYARRNIKLYFPGGYVNGLTAYDVVQTVLEKLLRGIRKWNREIIPDISTLVYLSIKSIIRNERNRKNRIPVISLYDKQGEINNAGLQYYSAVCRKDELSDSRLTEDEDSMLAKLEDSLEKDPYSYFVLQEMLNGNRTNTGIAGVLKIEVKDVANAKKRIRGKISRLVISDQ